MVRVPTLPENVTYGDDEARDLVMAKDAIEMVVASRLERGEEVPREISKTPVRQLTASVAA